MSSQNRTILYQSVHKDKANERRHSDNLSQSLSGGESNM